MFQRWGCLGVGAEPGRVGCDAEAGLSLLAPEALSSGSRGRMVPSKVGTSLKAIQ